MESFPAGDARWQDLDSQAPEKQTWMSASDHPLILQTLADYKYALHKHQQEQEIRKPQERQAQRQSEEEASRRYAAELAAREDAQRRSQFRGGQNGQIVWQVIGWMWAARISSGAIPSILLFQRSVEKKNSLVTFGDILSLG